jgi:uncharacterized repeat protein (TIGR03803 family)
MKTRIGRLCTFTLISLLSLFGLAVQAGAQGYTLSRPGGPPKLRPATGKTHKSETPDGYTYSVLYSFCATGGGFCTDGSQPFAGLIQDAAGNLYGTTYSGGANTWGTVFKLDDTGKETVLYSFCPGGIGNCTDGQIPFAGLLQDAAGNLYGTTYSGGANNGGTVFKLDDTGHETVLYSFCSVGGANCTDGKTPQAGLIQDATGSLYGTTSSGGANSGGTVFKLDDTGHETVLYSFCSVGGANCTDGKSPEAVLIQDAAGNLYGTTYSGGASGYAGTVFKVDSTGHETVLYNFCSEGGGNCTDGYAPGAGLIQDAAGDLYGTTIVGGANGLGTVFKVDSTGHETVLYNFCSEVSGANCTDGEYPSSGLIRDAAGNLYGTAGGGTGGGGVANCTANGFGGCGTVFKLDSTGHETVLYNFCSQGGANCTDGDSPSGGVIEDAAGNLYGTTLGGGANYAECGIFCGTVFKLTNSGGGGTATVTLTSSPNPSYVDQSVTLSAVVSGSGATPTGSVTFQEGSTVLGTVTLAGGKANLTTTFTTAGSDSIVAQYSGDKNYNPANSSPLTQVVNQYTTGTALVSNPNPSSYGQAVAFTATVSSAGPTPTGTVTFKNGSKSLGSATLSGGVAQITTSKLKVGSFTITASYGGDAANAGSTSKPLTQVVNKATSATTVVSSLNPSKVGKKVKFTATVTSATATPTGKVTFKDGSKTLGTGNLAKGKASYSTSTLSAGSHNITAVYAGTADISGSTSPVLVQTVN